MSEEVLVGDVILNEKEKQGCTCGQRACACCGIPAALVFGLPVIATPAVFTVPYLERAMPNLESQTKLVKRVGMAKDLALACGSAYLAFIAGAADLHFSNFPDVIPQFLFLATVAYGVSAHDLMEQIKGK